MKKIVLGSVAVTAMALLIGGCSSSDEPSTPPGPDFSAVEARFDHPDGTLSSGNVGAVLAQASTGGGVPALGGFGGASDPGDTSTQSLRPKSGDFEACVGLLAQRTGSCACPQGGALSWEMQGSGNASGSDVTWRLGFDRCGAQDSVIDGSEFMHIRGSGSGQTAQVSMLMVIDATVTHAGKSDKVDFQMRMSNNRIEMAGRVDDGWVVITIGYGTADGSTEYSVRDRNGTWTCKSTESGGTCTSDKGETVSYGG